MRLIEEISNQKGTYLVNCVGCKGLHSIATDKSSPQVWDFNCNFEKPTFNPSLLVQYPNYGEIGFTKKCHSFIRNGEWQFLSDCTHELAGKTVPMIDIDFEFDD